MNAGAVLAASSAVDAVVIFGRRHAAAADRGLRPNVLVKGGDYTEERVVGAREVRAWGGRVELVPLVPEISTARLMKKSASDSAVTQSRRKVVSA